MKPFMFLVALFLSVLFVASPALSQPDGVTNYQQTLLTSAYRTDSMACPPGTTNLYHPTSKYYKNVGYPGLVVWMDVTDTILTPSIVLNIQAYDLTSGKFATLLSSAAITGQTTTRLVIYPGCVAVSNVVLNQPAPHYWRVTAIPADTDSAKYSIGMEYLR